MIKRSIQLGGYDTAAYGWTLAGWQLGAAPQKTSYVNKTGGDGSWDLSTALTDGLLRYGDRSFTATLECSEGNRLTREEKIKHMINTLDGLRVNIKLPDDDLHYLDGRLHVVKNYNDLAHCAVTVTATCAPWKFATTETTITLYASTEKRAATLVNNGRRAVVPTLEVTGTGASVLLEYGTISKALSAGSYQWPDLLLTSGRHSLTYSGTGTVTITYREAVLE